MDKESRLLTIGEWLDKHGVDRTYTRDMRETYNNLKPDLEAQDTKSVKARDKEWVEWLEWNGVEIQVGSIQLDVGELVIPAKHWQALKRSIDEQS